jgi:hypothetical protein
MTRKGKISFTHVNGRVRMVRNIIFFIILSNEWSQCIILYASLRVDLEACVLSATISRIPILNRS